jgi:hypothetical protein
VLGAGGVASGISRRVGSAAVRGSEAALGAATEAAEALRLARVGGRAATSAGIRTGLDVLATERPLSGLERLAQRVLPQPTLKAIGADAPSLVPHALSPNPVTRGLQRGLQRYTTETLGPLRTQAAETAVQITDRAAAGLPESPALAAQFGKLTDTLAQAEAAGLTRVAKPALRELSLWNTTRKTLGELNAHWLQTRSDRLRAVSQTLNPFYKADKTFGERAHGAFMNLDVDLEGASAGLGPRLYHGTTETFEDFDPEAFDAGALYGPGVYLTDNPSTASGYGMGQQTGLSTEIFDTAEEALGEIRATVDEYRQMQPDWHIAEPQVKQTSAGTYFAETTITHGTPQVRGAYASVKNPFNIDEPMTDEMIGTVREGLRDYPGAVRAFDEVLTENVQAELTAGRPTTNQQIYDAIRGGISGGYGATKEDIAEASRFLENLGYDGITHVGGKISGRPPHQVTIAFHPEQVTSALAPPIHGLPAAKWAENVPARKRAVLDNPPPRPSVFDRVRDRGGLSVRLLTGEEPTAGYMVTLPSEQYGTIVRAADFFDTEAGIDEITDYVMAHQDELADNYLGIWHDADNGEVALDVALNVQDELAARTIALENDQQAIWDVVNGREIETGGTGAREALAGDLGAGAGAGARGLEGAGPGLGQAAPGPGAGGARPDVAGGLATLLAPGELRLAPEFDLGAIVQEAQATEPALLSKLDEIATATREHLSRISDDELAAKGVSRAQEIDASTRYMNGLYGAVDRAVKGHADDVDAAKDAMRWTLADEEMGRLRAGDTFEHMMERRYRPLAMKYGRRVNPDTLEFEGGLQWREFDDAMTKAGISQPLYFPFIDPERLRFSEFLLNRTRIGGVKAARDPHEKLMRGTLLERDTYLKDPMEAYTRRAARLTRAEETYRFIHGTVNALGHRVSSLDEITPGEMVVAPEGLWRTFRNKVAFDDVVDDLTSAGAKVDDTLAEALKSVVFKNQDEIVTAMGQTGKGMELWAVPANVARQMDSYAKFSGAFGSKTLRLFWDKPQDVWRAFVLSGSPRWLVNNAFGNTIFLKLQGGRMADVIRIAEERFKKLLNEKFGTQFSTKMLDQLADIPGMERVGSGYSSAEGMRGVHLGSAADTATGKFYQRLAGAGQTVTRGARAYGGFMTRLNSSIEEVFRQASYLKALERQQILSRVRPVASELWSTKARLDRMGRQAGEITEGQVRAALTEMNNAMGNYGALGPIERNIIRRFFVPFYGYMRHQGTLLARLPFENPIKMQLLSRLGDANEEFMEQYGPLPEWLAGAAPLGPPGPQVSFLASRGAEPFAGSFQDPVSMLSMPIKLALEQAQGRNSFTGEPFTDPDIIRPYGSDQAFRLIRDDAGNVVDAVPVGPARPGILEHVLSQFPQYEMAEQALGGGKAYDTSNLLQIAGGTGTRIDPETGLPLYPTGYGDQASRFLGFPSYEYDLQAYQERLAEQRQAALTQAAG